MKKSVKILLPLELSLKKSPEKESCPLILSLFWSIINLGWKPGNHSFFVRHRRALPSEALAKEGRKVRTAESKVSGENLNPALRFGGRGLVRATVTMRVASRETTKRLGTYF